MLDIDFLIEHEGNLYRTIFPNGYSVVFRLLTIREYKVLRKLRESSVLDSPSVMSEVYKRCCLNPDVSLDIRAGIVNSIGEFIMWLSGDCTNQTIKEDISNIRDAVGPHNALTNLMKSKVCLAFPTYTYDSLEHMNRVEFLRLFVAAENLLTIRDPAHVPLELKSIHDPNDPKDKPKGIDFAQENRQLRASQNPFDIEEAEKAVNPPRQAPKAAPQPQSKGSLNKEQLAKVKKATEKRR